MTGFRFPPRSWFARAGFLALALAATAAAVEVADPVIARRAGGLLTATAATPGSVGRYTLDGSDPTKSAGVWLAPVHLPPGYTLKARAFSADATSESGVITLAGESTGAKPASTLVPVTQNRDWRVYDWAERHAACVASMRARRPDIVMLGDSITHFWGGEPTSARRTGAEVWDRLFAARCAQRSLGRDAPRLARRRRACLGVAKRRARVHSRTGSPKIPTAGETRSRRFAIHGLPPWLSTAEAHLGFLQYAGEAGASRRRQESRRSGEK